VNKIEKDIERAFIPHVFVSFVVLSASTLKPKDGIYEIIANKYLF
jgi:hypothetical protein